MPLSPAALASPAHAASRNGPSQRTAKEGITHHQHHNAVAPPSETAAARRSPVETSGSSPPPVASSLNVDDAKLELRNSVSTFIRSMELLGPDEAVTFYKTKCDVVGVKPNNSFLRALDGDVSVINFANSYFGDRGMRAVAPTLARVPVIALDLRNTDLSTDDAAALQEALAQHPTLTMLDLREMTLSVPTARRFLSLVSQNKRLATVHLDDAAPKKLLILKQCIANTESCLYASCCLVCLKTMTHDEAHYSESNVLMRLAERLGRHIEDLLPIELEVVFRALLSCLDINDGVLFVCSHDCVDALVNDLVMACYAVRLEPARPPFATASGGAVYQPSPLISSSGKPNQQQQDFVRPKHLAVARCVDAVRDAASKALAAASPPPLFSQLTHGPGHSAPPAPLVRPVAADGPPSPSSTASSWVPCTNCGTACLPLKGAPGHVLRILAKDVGALMAKRMQLRPSAFSRLITVLLPRVDMSACTIKCIRTMVRFGIFGQGVAHRCHPYSDDVCLSEVCQLEPAPDNTTFFTIDIRNAGNLPLPDQDSTCAAAVASLVADSEKVSIDPLYLFACARDVAKMQLTRQFGVDIRSAIRATIEHGCLPLADAPFSLVGAVRDDYVSLESWKKLPAYESIRRAALARRKRHFCVVDGPYDNLFDNVRAALWTLRRQRRGVVGTMKWRLEWTACKDGVIPTEKFDGGFYIAVKLVGQAMLADGVLRLVLQPMLGTSVGRQGYFYASRTVVNRGFKQGAFAIIDDASTAPLTRTLSSAESTWRVVLPATVLQLLDVRRQLLTFVNVLPKLRSAIIPANDQRGDLGASFSASLESGGETTMNTREEILMHLGGLPSALAWLLSDVPEAVASLSSGERQLHHKFRRLLGEDSVTQVAFLLLRFMDAATRDWLHDFLMSDSLFILTDCVAAAENQGVGLARVDATSAPSDVSSMLSVASNVSMSGAPSATGLRRVGTMKKAAPITDRRLLNNPQFMAQQQALLELQSQGAKQRDEFQQRALQHRKRSRHYWGDTKEIVALASVPASEHEPMAAPHRPHGFPSDGRPSSHQEVTFHCFAVSARRLGQATIVSGDEMCVYSLDRRSVVTAPATMSSVRRLAPFPFKRGFDACCPFPLLQTTTTTTGSGGEPPAALASPLTLVFSRGYMVLWDEHNSACVTGPVDVRSYNSAFRNLPKGFARPSCALAVLGTSRLALLKRHRDVTEYVVVDVHGDPLVHLQDALSRALISSGSSTIRVWRSSDPDGPLAAMFRLFPDGPVTSFPINFGLVGQGGGPDSAAQSLLVGLDGMTVLFDWRTMQHSVSSSESASSTLRALPAHMLPGSLARAQAFLHARRDLSNAVTFASRNLFEPQRQRSAAGLAGVADRSGWHDWLTSGYGEVTMRAKCQSETVRVVCRVDGVPNDDGEALAMALFAPVGSTGDGAAARIADVAAVQCVACDSPVGSAADSAEPSLAVLQLIFDFGAANFCRFGTVQIVAQQCGGRTYSETEVTVSSSWDACVFHHVYRAPLRVEPSSELGWGPTHAARYWRVTFRGVRPGFSVARIWWFNASWATSYLPLQVSTPHRFHPSPGDSNLTSLHTLVTVTGGDVLDDPAKLVVPEAAAVKPVVRFSLRPHPEPHCVINFLSPFQHNSLLVVGRTFVELDSRDPKALGSRIWSLRAHPLFSALPFPFSYGLDAAFYPDPLNAPRFIVLLRRHQLLSWSLEHGCEGSPSGGGKPSGCLTSVVESQYFVGLPAPFCHRLDKVQNIWDAPGRLLLVSGRSVMIWYVPECRTVLPPTAMASLGMTDAKLRDLPAGHGIGEDRGGGDSHGVGSDEGWHDDSPWRLLALTIFPSDPRKLYFFAEDSCRWTTGSRDLMNIDTESQWHLLRTQRLFCGWPNACGWGTTAAKQLAATTSSDRNSDDAGVSVDRAVGAAIVIDAFPAHCVFTGVTVTTAATGLASAGRPAGDSHAGSAAGTLVWIVEASDDGLDWPRAICRYQQSGASSFTAHWRPPQQGHRFWRVRLHRPVESSASSGLGGVTVDVTHVRFHALPAQPLLTTPKIVSGSSPLTGSIYREAAGADRTARDGRSVVRLTPLASCKAGGHLAGQSNTDVVFDFEDFAAELCGVSFERDCGEETAVATTALPQCDVMAVGVSHDGSTWHDVGEWKCRGAVSQLHWAPSLPHRFWRLSLRASTADHVDVGNVSLLEYAGPSLLPPAAQDYHSALGLLCGATTAVDPFTAVSLPGSVGAEMLFHFKGQPRPLVGITIGGASEDRSAEAARGATLTASLAVPKPAASSSSTSASASSFSTSFAFEYSDNRVEWFLVGTLSLSSQAPSSLVWESEGAYRYWRLRVLHHYGGPRVYLQSLKLTTAGPSLYRRHRRHLVEVPHPGSGSFLLRGACHTTFVSVRAKVPPMADFLVEYLSTDNATWRAVAVLSNPAASPEFIAAAWPPQASSPYWRCRRLSIDEGDGGPPSNVEAAQWYTFSCDVLERVDMTSIDTLTVTTCAKDGMVAESKSAAGRPGSPAELCVVAFDNANEAPGSTLASVAARHLVAFPRPVAMAAALVTAVRDFPPALYQDLDLCRLSLELAVFLGGDDDVGVQDLPAVESQDANARLPSGPSVPFRRCVSQAVWTGRGSANILLTVPTDAPSSPRWCAALSLSARTDDGARGATKLSEFKQRWAHEAKSARFQVDWLTRRGATAVEDVDGTVSQLSGSPWLPTAVTAHASHPFDASELAALSVGHANAVTLANLDTLPIDAPAPKADGYGVVAQQLQKMQKAAVKVVTRYFKDRKKTGGFGGAANSDAVDVTNKIVTLYPSPRVTLLRQILSLPPPSHLALGTPAATLQGNGGGALVLQEFKLIRDVVTWPMPKTEYKGPLAASWLGLPPGHKVSFGLRWFVPPRSLHLVGAALRLAESMPLPPPFSAACVTVDVLSNWIPKAHFPAPLADFLCELGLTAAPAAFVFSSETFDCPDPSFQIFVPNSTVPFASSTPFTIFRGLNVMSAAPSRPTGFVGAPLLTSFLFAVAAQLGPPVAQTTIASSSDIPGSQAAAVPSATTLPPPLVVVSTPFVSPTGAADARGGPQEDHCFTPIMLTGRVTVPVGHANFGFPALDATMLSIEYSPRGDGTGGNSSAEDGTPTTLATTSTRRIAFASRECCLTFMTATGEEHRGSASKRDEESYVRVARLPCGIHGHVATTSSGAPPVVKLSGQVLCGIWERPLGLPRTLSIQNIRFSAAAILGADSFTPMAHDLRLTGDLILASSGSPVAGHAAAAAFIPVVAWIPSTGVLDDVSTLQVTLQNMELPEVLRLCAAIGCCTDEQASREAWTCHAMSIRLSGTVELARHVVLEELESEAVVAILERASKQAMSADPGSTSSLTRGAPVAPGAASPRKSAAATEMRRRQEWSLRGPVLIAAAGRIGSGALSASPGSITVSGTLPCVDGLDVGPLRLGSATRQMAHSNSTLSDDATLEYHWSAPSRPSAAADSDGSVGDTTWSLPTHESDSSSSVPSVIGDRRSSGTSRITICGAGEVLTTEPTFVQIDISQAFGLRASCRTKYFHVQLCSSADSSTAPNSACPSRVNWRIHSDPVVDVSFDVARFVGPLQSALQQADIVAELMSAGVPFAFNLTAVAAASVDLERHSVVVALDGVFFGTTFSVHLIDNSLASSDDAVAALCHRAAARIVESVSPSLWLLVESLQVVIEHNTQLQPRTRVAQSPRLSASFLSSWSGVAEAAHTRVIAAMVDPT